MQQRDLSLRGVFDFCSRHVVLWNPKYLERIYSYWIWPLNHLLGQEMLIIGLIKSLGLIGPTSHNMNLLNEALVIGAEVIVHKSHFDRHRSMWNPTFFLLLCNAFD